ncbi:MAG: hypothetical protein D6682_03040, partial [Zetaproteobacteria bacterium]
MEAVAAERPEGDPRLSLARRWLGGVLGSVPRLEPLAGDASFRRYFRLRMAEGAFVLMDAPPDRESVAPFLRVRRWLEGGGVRVPHLIAQDGDAGFLLLEDFGDRTWARALEEGASVAPLLQAAMEQLLRLQRLDPAAAGLPSFDVTRMQRECALYLDWYLPYLCDRRPDETERARFFAALEPLLRRIASQPYVPVHLDFHSRNLMDVSQEDGAPVLGVIDFQDAVRGPLTYDLASLLYDCYQDYGEEQASDWSGRFFDLLPERMRAAFSGRAGWHEALRCASLQRHIKVCGIFARLAFRDGKRQFLDHLPQTRRHLLA